MRTKILILSFVMIIFMAFIASTGYIDLKKSNEDVNALYNDSLGAIEVGSDIRVGFYLAQVSLILSAFHKTESLQHIRTNLDQIDFHQQSTF